jgi:hypothetical protein
MQGPVLRLGVLGVLLPLVFIAILYLFRPGAALKEWVGLLLLLTSPPWPLLGTVFPGLLKMQALFMAIAITLNGLLYAGMGAWIASSQGRPAPLRYGPVVVTWIVLLGIARTLTD